MSDDFSGAVATLQPINDRAMRFGWHISGPGRIRTDAENDATVFEPMYDVPGLAAALLRVAEQYPTPDLPDAADDDL